MNELHLFAGAGGGILGSILLGHRPVCAVEIEAYPRKVMLQRQRDGILPRFPIWDDITTFDGKPFTEEERRSMRAGNGGQLNPDWVEWLMGWPIGYTDLKLLAMDRFHRWLRGQAWLRFA